MAKKFPTIYKKTSSGAIQIWYQEISDDECSYRTVSGQIDGKKTESAFKAVEQKNVGKTNETSLSEQCVLEVEANYKKKLAQGNYKETLDEEALSKDNFFKPMLAKTYVEDGYVYSPGDDVYSQQKIDGIRCIATSKGLFSRQGKQILSAPHILEALAPMFEEDSTLILDGELYSDRLSDDFNEIISLARQAKPTEEDFARSKETLQYWIYDVNSKHSYDRRFAYLQDTLSLSGNLYPDFSNYIKLVETTKVTSQDHLDSLYAKYMEDGYEGQIIRINGNGYENKRSKQLQKRKEFIDDEFIIDSIKEGQGNWAGYAKKVVFKLNDGTDRTSDAGVAGNQAFTKNLIENASKFFGTLVTIRYQNLTPDGKPRFAVATKFLGTKEREL